MVKANQDIRKALAEKKIKQWQLADKLGIREEKLARQMRYELSEDEKERIFKLIDEMGDE